MQRANRHHRRLQPPGAARAPLRRPGAEGGVRPVPEERISVGTPPSIMHPLGQVGDDAALFSYESGAKESFDAIIPTLRAVSALQHETDFVSQAQQLAVDRLGFELPEQILEDAWIEQLDMRRLYAWCVFATYQRFCDRYFRDEPLASKETGEFTQFLQDCGFHTLDISPCADGRLAHLVRYVLRLPSRSIRRKSYAGAMFDIEDSLQKWIEVEMRRYREGQPNLADAPTSYLKLVAYHHSSVDPAHQGCAAHGSDTTAAAAAAVQRLRAFQQAVENSFCCGASIGLLLIGVDTDTDAIRVHVPDASGAIDAARYVDALELYESTLSLAKTAADQRLRDAVRRCSPDVAPGMLELIVRLLQHNLAQIGYVRRFHGLHYPDIGHAERFIGAGIGFQEIQLRNLMYFAYLKTVEEGVNDLDIGIKIFTGLNLTHGLPIPVVVRFDYHGAVPGSRERAVDRCRRVEGALKTRYRELSDQRLLHTLLLVRDCDMTAPIEVIGCSVLAQSASGAH